jgi:hypothetical protein
VKRNDQKETSPHEMFASSELVVGSIWMSTDRAHRRRLVRVRRVRAGTVCYAALRSWCRAQRNRVWWQPVAVFTATHTRVGGAR